jgi:hypothetical protein
MRVKPGHRSSGPNLNSAPGLICGFDHHSIATLLHCPFGGFSYRVYFASVYINCTATVPAADNPYAMTAKTRAIPGLHRDYSRLKYQDSARMLRQVTQPPFIAGPLGKIAAFRYILAE